MTIKEMGNKRTGKTSKNKNKSKQVKCKDCHKLITFIDEDVIQIGKLKYIECECGNEIKIK